MPLQHLVDVVSLGVVDEVESENIAQHTLEGVVREEVQVANRLHQLARAVGISQLALVCQVSELGEERGEPFQTLRAHIGTVGGEQCELAGHVRVVDDVAAEDVSADAEEVVPQEWEARPVRKDDEAETLTRLDELLLFPICAPVRPGAEPRIAVPNNAPPIPQSELAVVSQRLQDAHDLQGRFVGLVDHETVAVAHGAHHGAVLTQDNAGFQ
mmetsp:Transcript_29099/g.86538  ORF Transcript_29099/g.86538 Transcript_29099/m.86538 type:complete len:213 (+) Transcript_29099:136-774(+)